MNFKKSDDLDYISLFYYFISNKIFLRKKIVQKLLTYKKIKWLIDLQNLNKFLDSFSYKPFCLNNYFIN